MFTSKRRFILAAVASLQIPATLAFAQTTTTPAPAAPSVAAPPPATASLPVERNTYFLGEIVPVAISGAGGAANLIELVDENGVVAATGQGTNTAWRFDTTRLAPGNYSLRLNGVESEKLILVSTVRNSVGTMSDSSGPSLDYRKTGKEFEADQQRLHKTISETGLAVATGVGNHEGMAQINNRKLRDETARYGLMQYTNPYDRSGSFFGARVYEPEMEGITERMIQLAHVNSRYPTFGGFIYHWDPIGFNRNDLFYYWEWGGQELPGREYMKRAENAIFAEFKRRTGLEPVTTSEFMQYCAAVRRPELGPAFDLPTYQWLKEISAKYPPMSAEQIASLEKRMDAYTRFLQQVLPEANAYHQKWLRKIDPSLKNSSSHDNQFTPREGSWPPAAYEPLDFRWVEAWSDQVSGPDYVYQWLFHAAIVDTGNTARQPVWTATVQGSAHDVHGTAPGRMMRAAAHNLAYSGRGLGIAFEGFSGLLGGMASAQTAWQNISTRPARYDWELARDFLHRFAPMEEQSQPVRQVGILLSEGNYSRQQQNLIFGTPPYEVFIDLARLGYTPRFLTEKNIREGGLKGFESLIVLNQLNPLPAEVLTSINTFAQAGGKVLRNVNSTAPVPGAQELKLDLPFQMPGRPYNWGAVNFADELPPQMAERHLMKYAPVLREALGEASRTVLIPEENEKSLTSTFALGGGPDATYVVATNDSYPTNASSWWRQDTKLTPNAAAGADKYSALYDLTDESSLGKVGPVTARFQDRTARLFGLLTRPVAAIDFKATQAVAAGDPVRLSVGFNDAQGTRLQAAIPFYLKLMQPDGKLSVQYYRSTSRSGHFAMPIHLGVNAPAGRWQLSLRSLLDGRTVTLPIDVQAAKSVPVTAVSEVISRNSSQIAEFWKSKPKLVAPVFVSPGQKDALAAAQIARDTLKPLGVGVEIRENPEVTSYTYTWVHTPEQLQENRRVESGEALGKTFNAMGYQNEYWPTVSGYVYGRPLLLLDLAGVKDNPIAEKLTEAGMVWPKVTPEFPGTGRATIQFVPSALKLGVDVVIVQAADSAGLTAGVKALAAPPADWLTTGVANARRELQREMSIGRTPEDAAGLKLLTEWKPAALTAKDAQLGQDSKPLGLSTVPPLPGIDSMEPKERAHSKLLEPQPRIVNDVPGTYPANKWLVPMFRPQGEWVRGWGGTGDMRFAEGHIAKIHVAEAGKYVVKVKGTFRYSDRRPAIQPRWLEWVDLREQVVKPQRKPMSFEVLLDRQPLGDLKELQTAEREVTIYFTLTKNEKKPEEVVTEVSGTLNLPAGEHELLLIHKNMIDGTLGDVEVTKVP